MTPEERAVIEAAERYCADSNAHERLRAHERIEPTLGPLLASVRALRESRKPKPRWQAATDFGVIRDTHDPGLEIIVQRGYTRFAVDLNRVLDALNRAEPV